MAQQSCFTIPGFGTEDVELNDVIDEFGTSSSAITSINSDTRVY